MSISGPSTYRPTMRGLLAACFAGAMAIWSQIGAAQSDGPFAMFTGSWGGSGEAVGAHGHREQIRCRAVYSLSENGEAATQTLVCASASYQIDINSHFVAQGHRIQGHWQEATRQVQGNLTGWIADGQFEGSVAGSNFTARVTLRSTGRKQLVYISSSGGDIAILDVALSHAEI